MAEALQTTSTGASLVKLGRTLVPKLAICLRTARLYDSANVNVREAARQLVEIAKTIYRMEGRAQLALIVDFLTLNDVRLKSDLTGHGTFRFLVQRLQELKIGTIQFGFETTPDDVVRFCKACNDVPSGDEAPYKTFLEFLAEAGVSSIQTEEFDCPAQLQAGGVLKDVKQRSVRTFFQSIRVAREILAITDPRKMKFRKAKRVVQKMVDVISEDESILLSLTSIKNYDEYTFNHSANVAVYVIAFGQKLGLDKRALADLGMSGLFHDVGKTRVPKEILNKPGRLSEDEWEVMKNHSVYGAEILLKSRELTDSTIRNILVAFEHHLNLDLGGYPSLTDLRDLNLFSKIVAIADCFDALTTPRAYRNVHYSPQEALSIMMEGRGTLFDPTLLKIFVSAIGVYPIGTLVELDTGETALVVRTNDESGNVGKPVVKVIADREGQEIPSRILDLSAEPGEGETVPSIVRTMDPADHFDSIQDYLDVL